MNVDHYIWLLEYFDPSEVIDFLLFEADLAEPLTSPFYTWPGMEVRKLRGGFPLKIRVSAEEFKKYDMDNPEHVKELKRLAKERLMRDYQYLHRRYGLNHLVRLATTDPDFGNKLRSNHKLWQHWDRYVRLVKKKNKLLNQIDNWGKREIETPIPGSMFREPHAGVGYQIKRFV